MYAHKTTRTKVARYRIKHSDWTLQQIGTKCGVSRERIRQILKKMGLQTRSDHFIKIKKCVGCDNIVTSRDRIYCSNDCYTNNHSILVFCSTCQKVKRIRKADYNRNNNQRRYTGRFFCDRNCFYISKRG
ncbi:MAG: sigma factor-like helix-turn-helix DNA-binding protein, partial [Nanoarchaeota archaeon]